MSKFYLKEFRVVKVSRSELNSQLVERYYVDCRRQFLGCFWSSWKIETRDFKTLEEAIEYIDKEVELTCYPPDIQHIVRYQRHKQQESLKNMQATITRPLVIQAIIFVICRVTVKTGTEGQQYYDHFNGEWVSDLTKHCYFTYESDAFNYRNSRLCPIETFSVSLIVKAFSVSIFHRVVDAATIIE